MKYQWTNVSGNTIQPLSTVYFRLDKKLNWFQRLWYITRNL